jgi:hypothetical protein
MEIKIDEVLDERGKRYGEFASRAFTAQKLKLDFVEGRKLAGRLPMPPLQQEAMDMILHKISRIAHGDETYEDNWIDIVGYAQLVVNELHKGE